jgi:hypothetical protein
MLLLMTLVHSRIGGYMYWQSWSSSCWWAGMARGHGANVRTSSASTNSLKCDQLAIPSVSSANACWRSNCHNVHRTLGPALTLRLPGQHNATRLQPFIAATISGSAERI